MASDHCPILIKCEPPGVDSSNPHRRNRRFLFEEMWTKEEECGRVVSQVWAEGRHRPVATKIRVEAERLKVWEKEKFGSVRRDITDLRKELDDIQRLYPSSENLQQRREVELKLDKVLEREEIMWCQRARINWLRYGDRNTKFFHNYAKQRGRTNKIVGILGEDNRWRTGAVEIGCEFVNYFRQLFTSSGGQFQEALFDAVDARIS